MVLEFVPHHIPNYREIVKLAVIKDIGALRHASSELLNDDLFLVSMIKEHPELFDRIKASSRQDPKVLKQLTDFSTDPVFKTSFTETQIKACLTPTSIPDTITDVTTAPEWPTESQKESLLALLKARAIDGTTIYAALPPSLRTDTAWALACVQENHSCLTSIIKTLPKSTIELFLIQAFKQSNETNREALFDLFPDEFKNDASFMIQCLGYRQIIIHSGDYDEGEVIALNEKQGIQDKGDVYLFKKNGQWILAFDSPEDTCLEKNLSNHTKLLELLTSDPINPSLLGLELSTVMQVPMTSFINPSLSMTQALFDKTVSSSLKKDESFLLDLIATHPTVFNFLDSKWKDNREFAQQAIKKNLSVLDYTPFKSDKPFLLQCIRDLNFGNQDTKNLLHILASFENDIEVAHSLLKKDPWVFKKLPSILQKDKTLGFLFLSAALQQDLHFHAKPLSKEDMLSLNAFMSFLQGGTLSPATWEQIKTNRFLIKRVNTIIHTEWVYSLCHLEKKDFTSPYFPRGQLILSDKTPYDINLFFDEIKAHAADCALPTGHWNTSKLLGPGRKAEYELREWVRTAHEGPSEEGSPAPSS